MTIWCIAKNTDSMMERTQNTLKTLKNIKLFREAFFVSWCFLAHEVFLQSTILLTLFFFFFKKKDLEVLQVNTPHPSIHIILCINYTIICKKYDWGQPVRIEKSSIESMYIIGLGKLRIEYKTGFRHELSLGVIGLNPVKTWSTKGYLKCTFCIK